MKKKRSQKLPWWSEGLLQGLAYWSGYRRTLHRHHPLTEGAIVVEAAGLLSNPVRGNAESQQYLYCEIPCRNVAKSPDGWGRMRFDMILATETIGQKEARRHTFSRSVRAVIEVKRGSASAADLNKDLNRRARIVDGNKAACAFLIVACQGQAHARALLLSAGAASRPGQTRGPAWEMHRDRWREGASDLRQPNSGSLWAQYRTRGRRFGKQPPGADPGTLCRTDKAGRTETSKSTGAAYRPFVGMKWIRGREWTLQTV